MDKPEISIAVYLFVLCEFFVGAIIGASVAKDRTSWSRGMAIALVLALVVIVYGIVIGTLATQRFDSPLGRVIGIFGAVIGSLVLGFCLWFICLLAAVAGYWSTFVIFRRLGIGPNRVTVAAIFAFITILAAVAALARMT
jgi:hypothetical protein